MIIRVNTQILFAVLMTTVPLLISGCFFTKDGTPILKRGNAFGFIPDKARLVGYWEKAGDEWNEFSVTRKSRSEFLVSQVKSGAVDTHSRRTILRKLKNDFYIAQLENSALFKGKTEYLLIKTVANRIDYYTGYREAIPKHPELKKIALASDGKNSTISTERDLFNFYTYLVDNINADYMKRGSYLIYDESDPTSMKELDELRAKAEKESKRELASQKEAQKKKVAVAQSGTWFYKAEKDPITDKKKQFVFGSPVKYESTRDTPFIRIGCYDDGMGVTLYWGAVLKDLYPSGEANAVRVTMRFDSTEPMDTGWAVSDNFSTTFAPGAGLAAVSGLGELLISELVPIRSAVSFNWTPERLYKIMLAGSRMVLRASNRSGGDVTLIFDLSGFYDVASSNFRSSCG